MFCTNGKNLLKYRWVFFIEKSQKGCFLTSKCWRCCKQSEIVGGKSDRQFSNEDRCTLLHREWAAKELICKCIFYAPQASLVTRQVNRLRKGKIYSLNVKYTFNQGNDLLLFLFNRWFNIDLALAKYYSWKD